MKKQDTPNIDKLMISLFNLQTYHMDLTDKEKNLIKETYIEEGRKLYMEKVKYDKKKS